MLSVTWRDERSYMHFVRNHKTVQVEVVLDSGRDGVAWRCAVAYWHGLLEEHGAQGSAQAGGFVHAASSAGRRYADPNICGYTGCVVSSGTSSDEQGTGRG